MFHFNVKAQPPENIRTVPRGPRARDCGADGDAAVAIQWRKGAISAIRYILWW